MKKYKNLASQLSVITVLIDLVFVITLIFGIIYNDDIPSLIVMVIVLLLSLIMFNSMYVILQDQFYITYIGDEVVIQKFFFKKKSIEFNKVKYIYFIDQLLILSKKKIDFENNKINLKTKKKIKKELKEGINIWINLSDSYLPYILEEQCPNAEYVFIGKMNKFIIKKFSKNPVNEI